MSATTRTATAIKGHLPQFSGIIAKGLSRSKQRLVKEMIHGTQAVEDVELSNITPALIEPIPLIKIGDWLSRSLDDEEFTGEIHKEICRLGTEKIADGIVIAIDPGDIEGPISK